MRVFHSCNSIDPDLFQKVKESVSMQQVAEYYGLQVNRKGLCLCPFHQDKDPSLKLYPNGKGFYCFSCGTGGDQIKFAALYRDVSNAEAARELADAFGVPIQVPVSYWEKREADLSRRRRREITAFAKRTKMYLTAYYSLLCEAVRKQNDHFYEGLSNLSWTQYILEQIEECPENVWKDRKAVKKIGEIEGRIGDWYFSTGTDGSISGRDILSDFRD